MGSRHPSDHVGDDLGGRSLLGSRFALLDCGNARCGYLSCGGRSVHLGDEELAMSAVDYVFAERRAFDALHLAYRTGDNAIIRAALREWAVAAYQRRVFGA